MKIAIVSVAAECNAWAPVLDEEDFRERLFVWGEEIAMHPDLRSLLPGAQEEGFGQTMDRLRDWQAVPIAVCVAPSGGPIEHSFFEGMLDRIAAELIAKGTFDAVYVPGHGAAITTQSPDADGLFLERLRATVGPGVPIAATFDYHANISDRALACLDILVGYKTNPHVDVPAREAETAALLSRRLDGQTLACVHTRVPLVTPQVCQLTSPDMPMGAVVGLAASLETDAVPNISVFPGFALADVPHGGMLVTAVSASREEALRSVNAVARNVWERRNAFEPAVLAVEQAIDRVKADSSGPWIFADVADNPGGGARGNTVWLMETLRDAGIEDVLVGLFYDPVAVETAFAKGVGASYDFIFNTTEQSPLSGRLSARVRVEALSDGAIECRLGIAPGKSNLGRTCRLSFDGIEVIANEKRQQILTPEIFEVLGANTKATKVIVVKSRGHFRAGFAHLVTADRILEVDSPGLTAPSLQAVPFARLPQTHYPFNRAASLVLADELAER